mgnify:CR=1 FL=1
MPQIRKKSGFRRILLQIQANIFPKSSFSPKWWRRYKYHAIFRKSLKLICSASILAIRRRNLALFRSSNHQTDLYRRRNVRLLSALPSSSAYNTEAFSLSVGRFDTHIGSFPRPTPDDNYNWPRSFLPTDPEPAQNGFSNALRNKRPNCTRQLLSTIFHTIAVIWHSSRKTAPQSYLLKF